MVVVVVSWSSKKYILLRASAVLKLKWLLVVTTFYQTDSHFLLLLLFNMFFSRTSVLIICYMLYTKFKYFSVTSWCRSFYILLLYFSYFSLVLLFVGWEWQECDSILIETEHVKNMTLKLGKVLSNMTLFLTWALYADELWELHHDFIPIISVGTWWLVHKVYVESCVQ